MVINNMANVEMKTENQLMTISLKGHIDSNNAGDAEAAITAAIEAEKPENILIDAQELDYISSAGLRIILRLRKEYPELRIINVKNEVYEVLDMTGFTEMIKVEKAYRVISVDGCEVIGQGANGKVYRIDQDTIVKVYYNPDSLPDIQRERELARTAFVLGIPTAIPYDVVKIGNEYGSVFELLNAKSFAKLMSEDPSRLDEIVKMSVDLLKKIHGTEAKPGTMPGIKESALKWAEFLKDHLPAEPAEKLYRMIEAVPDDNHMMHGDFHLKNIMLQNDEVLLIDMDTICTGHPIFEFSAIYNAYRGFSSVDPTAIERFLGITAAQGKEIWDKTLHLYFDDRSDEEIDAITDKARIISYARIMRRQIRHNDIDPDISVKLIDFCKTNLLELLEKYDTLTF